METKTIKGYKFIQEDMKSKYGDHKWELGKWYSCDEDKIKLYKYGFHACLKPIEALDFVYGDKFFIIEARGKIIHDKGVKFVASEMRLIKELSINPIFKRFAIWNAKQCLKNYEKEYPNDKRVSECIQATEDYLDGKISLDELSAARSAAESAAWSAESAESAAESAAWSAESAESAAESAAWSARSAAESAAWSARSAAESAESAARSAAWSARSAARSAAWSARSAAESAESAARSAAWSARSAAWSARSAAESAESAARSAQNKALKQLIKKYTRNTPDNIKSLKKEEVFIFGSNKAGKHDGGAAKFALDKFNAEYGIGEGLTGKCYAFPTLDENFKKLDLKEIKKSVGKLNKVAKKNPYKIFLLTKVGCGIAGYKEEEIKKLFKKTELNIIKPKGW